MICSTVYRGRKTLFIEMRVLKNDNIFFYQICYPLTRSGRHFEKIMTFLNWIFRCEDELQDKNKDYKKCQQLSIVSEYKT